MFDGSVNDIPELPHGHQKRGGTKRKKGSKKGKWEASLFLCVWAFYTGWGGGGERGGGGGGKGSPTINGRGGGGEKKLTNLSLPYKKTLGEERNFAVSKITGEWKTGRQVVRKHSL